MDFVVQFLPTKVISDGEKRREKRREMEGKGGRGIKREEEGYDLCLLSFTPRVPVILYVWLVTQLGSTRHDYSARIS